MKSLIVAIARGGVIGGDNQLLWHISEDLKNFKRVTSGHPVVMGRKTFESLGRPLPKRENVVISRTLDEVAGCRVAHSLEEALGGYSPCEEIFVIGGAEIYRAALPLCDRFYLTRVHHDFQGDTLFPEYDPAQWQCVSSEHFERGATFEHPFTIEEYIRVGNSSSSVQITQVTPLEIPIIQEVALPAFEATYRDIVSPEQNEYMLDMMYSTESLNEQFAAGQLYYILFEAGRAVGYLSLLPKGDDYIYLDKIYLLPASQGGGRGAQLIAHAFNEAKRLCGGNCMIELSVNRYNQKAVDFYLRQGMAIDRQGDYKIEGTEFIRPDYIMRKDLK